MKITEIKLLAFKALARFRYLVEAKPVRTINMAYHYLSKFANYKDIYDNKPTAKKNNVYPNTIWIYWRQGEQNAPEIVRKCINSARNNALGYNVVVLNGQSLSEYIELPDYIEKKHNDGIIKEALYSDLLRISLLTEYGGIWCDATCYWSYPLTAPIKNADFFMFSTPLTNGYISPIVCSNWFIKSNRNNPLLVKTRNYLFTYWKKHSFLPNYFIFHLVFSYIAKTDEESNKIWKEMPYVTNEYPHLLQVHFADKYNQNTFEWDMNSCFIHKLTYKFDKRLLENNEENVLQHLLATI